ncbi:MAG: isoaspartyl peptidase/L-asparaginase [Acidimicrobiales bacterium]|jgi:isoaspartyl peptidase/L-asparaginase-like protein (Ntn-hydrolase superfamily)
MTPGAHIEAGSLDLPAVVIHGGAGVFEEEAPAELARIESDLFTALAAAWAVLDLGGPALDAVVEAVASLEASGHFDAGRGSVPTTDGTVETDSSVMDGASGNVGAVCCATWPDSPVRAARQVMSLGAPAEGPVLLAGPGADRFCEEAGLPRRDPALLTAAGVRPVSQHGTVGAVAVDRDGHLAAATSTGGRDGQLPGRVGDSPIIGAGTWADDRSVAVSATGDGESFIVAGFAHRIDWAVLAGSPLDEALEGALGSVRDRSGTGGGIVLAGDGRFAVGCNTPAMARGWRDSGGPVVLPLWLSETPG